MSVQSRSRRSDRTALEEQARALLRSQAVTVAMSRGEVLLIPADPKDASLLFDWLLSVCYEEASDGCTGESEAGEGL